MVGWWLIPFGMRADDDKALGHEPVLDGVAPGGGDDGLVDGFHSGECAPGVGPKRAEKGGSFRAGEVDALAVVEDLGRGGADQDRPGFCLRLRRPACFVVPPRPSFRVPL
jgi:hypothetical protein